MQMIRSHIQKQDAERRNDKKIDLDEKIRQIREQNKAREKRFKEIEEDKLSASQSDIYVTHDNKTDEKQHKNEQLKRGGCMMPGICNTTERKLTKGRGQRLLEISKEPLKARDFESKAVKGLTQMVLEEHISIEEESKKHQRSSEHKSKAFHGSNMLNIGLSNPILVGQYLKEQKKRERLHGSNSERVQNRKYGCFNVWKRENKPEEISESNKSTDDHSLHHEIIKDLPKTSSGWISSQNKHITSSEEWHRGTEMVESPDGSKIEKYSIVAPKVNDLLKKENHVKPCDNNTGEKGEKHDDNKSHKHIESCYDKDNLKPKKAEYLPETLKDTNDNKNAVTKKEVNRDILTQLTENNPTELDKPKIDEKAESSVEEDKKAGKPKITVNIKKTASTTSFDEVMSMLSPLDVPTNWGDCDFDDNDDFLPPITF